MMMIPNTMMGINATSSSSPSPSPQNPTTTTTTTTTSSSDPSSFPSSNPNKRKRRPAGTPDPDAEVVSLSPKTLLESDRYVCEICNQGFQRDQNLQMHRRRHKVPWKLLKRERDTGDPAAATRKRVYVCPETSCLHHDPGHALGDLVGIKKHFRRKHSDRRQWVCERCGKGYAVQSDYKAHLKTCGTRGHSCDCGRVFSRVGSFIEHQDACNMGHLKSSSNNNNNDSPQKLKPQCLSKTTASSPSPSSDTNTTTTNNNNNKSPRTWWPPLPPLSLQPITLLKPNIFKSLASEKNAVTHTATTDDFHNLDLQLSSSSPSPGAMIPTPTKKDEQFFPPRSTRLRLSIGTCDAGDGEGAEKTSSLEDSTAAEKAHADEARRQARRQIEMAEKELADAKRMRKQALTELEKARAIKEQARDQIKSVVLEITCNTCKQRIQGKELAAAVASLAQEENSLVLSYVSSAITEGEVDEHNGV